MTRTSNRIRERFDADPRDRAAFESLEEEYFVAGRSSDLIALYEAHLAASGDARTPLDRARLLFRLGQALEESGDTERAAESFRAAVALDASFAPALRRLQSLETEPGILEDTLDAPLAPATPPPDTAPSLREIAERALAAGEHDAALRAFEQAHARDPGDPRCLDGLFALHLAAGRPEAAAALGPARVESCTNVERRASIALELGRLHLDVLHQPIEARRWLERAAEDRSDGSVHLALAEAAGQAGDGPARVFHLERAMELGAEIPAWSALGLGDDDETGGTLDALRRTADERPADPDALDALAAELGSRGEHTERVGVLARRAELASGDRAEAAELWFEIGEIRAESLADPAGAVAAFRRALDADPERALGIDALESSLRALGRLDELAEAIAAPLRVAPPARRAALECRLGNAALERSDASAALAHFRAALDAEPGHARAEQGLARAAEAGADEATLFDAWSREAAHCTPERLAELGRAAAERAAVSDDPDRALAVLRCWADRAGTRDALESLATLLGELGQSDELAAVLARLDQHLEPVERAAQRRRLGYQHAAEGRTDLAVAAWREALALDANDLASYEALASTLAEGGEDAALIAMCEGSRLASPQTESLLGQALERAGRIDDAARVLRALAATGAPDGAAIASFERVSRALGDPEARSEALALAAPRETGAARDALLLERAELLDVVLDRPAEAHAVYLALEAEACDDAARARAAQSLDALLERSGAIAPLCQRLAARAEAAEPEMAVALQLRIADLAEHRLCDAPRAHAHLEAALAIDPRRPDAWRRLGALATEPRDRLRALEGELATGPDPERAVALHLTIAQLACGELADPARAAASYRAALAIDAGEPEANAWLGAELEREGRHAELAALLRAQLSARPDGDSAAALALRVRLAALLTEKLDRPEEAALVLEEAYRANGPAAPLVEPLAALFERLGRSVECAELCEAAAEVADHPSRGAALWARAAGAARAAGDSTRAGRALRRALDLDPDAREALVALVALSRELGDDAALVDLLERELEAAGSDALALRCELTLRYARLGRAERACDHAIAAATLAPADATLREPAVERALAQDRVAEAAALLLAAARDPRSEAPALLWRRHAELMAASDPEEAARSYEHALEIDPSAIAVRRARRRLLERLGRSAEALVELEAEIEHAPSAERAALIAEGADLALRAHGAADTLPWLGRLVAEQPDDAALWCAIADRYALARQHALQERALREASRRCERRGDAAAIERTRAALFEGPLADPGLALAAWRSAQEFAPDHPDTLAALERLYTGRGRTRDAVEVQVRRAVQAHGARRAEILVRAAEGAESLGDLGQAATLWEAALAPGLVAPARRPALLERAVEAQRRAGRVDAFLALAEEELSAPRDAARCAELHRAVARGWRTERARPDRALAHLRALVDAGLAAPDDDAALLAALRAAGAHAETAVRLEASLRARPDDAPTWQELATLREELLWDAAGAAEAWRALARLEPLSVTAHAGLRRASERAGDARGLDAALEREIELGSVEAAAAWRRLGRLRRDTLRDLAGAERAFERALALDARDRATLEALRELAEARGDWTRALELGAREIESVDPADTRARQALWLHRADRAIGPARDFEAAIAAFEAADALEALPAAALAAWAGILRDLGPAAGWRDVFSRFCDHPDAKPDARDHLALAQSLADAGRDEAAAERLRAVFALAPEHAGAWALAARLREASGDAEAICDAWSRAARASTALDAARAWRAAAAPFEGTDPARAIALLERAVEAYPSFAPAHAARAITAERLGRFEIAVEAAKAALDCRGIAAPLLRDEHRDATCAGARAAHALSRWGDAWQLASETLALAPGDPDALLVQGIAAQHLGSAHAARRALEAWLATDPPEAQRAIPLCALGGALADLGERAAALACWDDALAIEPSLEAVNAARCALLERGGDGEAAAEAYARWAAATDAPVPRAERFARAATLLGAAAPRAGAWIEQAIEADPQHAPAWLAWLDHLAVHGSEAQRLAAAERGAAQVGDPRAAARLEIERARILEARNDLRRAREAFVRAVELDASQDEAAWAAARLLRHEGDWSAAAACLGSAAERHADATVRAALLAERGRLCAGPLEDLAGAIAAYEEARALAPDRPDLGEALAALWAQQPETRDRARGELCRVLAQDPVRPTAWRRLARLLRDDGRERDADRGMALLRALGAATSAERATAPGRVEFAIATGNLDDGVGETLREAFRAIAGDWAEALSDVLGDTTGTLDPALADMAARWKTASADAVGPPLAGLAPETFAAQAEALVWTALGAAATVEASYETRGVVERVSARALRRLRRGLGGIEPAVLRRFDFAGWTTALRAGALAAAVDASGGDLRVGLACARADALRASGEAIADEADLTPFAASRGTVRELVTQAVRAWLASL